MTTGDLLKCVPLLVLLVWAAVVDVRTRRIPNWLTFSLIISGLVQGLVGFNYGKGPGEAVLGLLTGFGLTFVLFAIGALGGGDVKLLAGLGAWLGPWPTLLVFANAAIIGMLIVLVQAIAQGRLVQLFRNSAVIAMSLAHASDAAALEQAAETGKACSSRGREPLPYAVPVLLATVVTMLWL